MSIREQIAPLEELSAIDVAIKRIDEQLEKQRGGLSTMQADVKQLDGRLKVDRDMLATMDKTRSELLIELRQMSQQLDRSREKLQRTRNEREANAAQREVEEMRKLLRDREDEVERLATASDQARTTIQDGETKHKSLAGELEGSEGGIASSIEELVAERATKAAERAAVIKSLPSALVRRYDSVRTRRPVAIARTYDGTCLGCHLSVPPMMFQKMRRQDEFEQCPNCRRILYYMLPPASDPSTTESQR